MKKKIFSTLLLFLIPVGMITAADWKAYVTNYSTSNVTSINLSINTPDPIPIPVGSSPEGIEISPDGKFAYVANAGQNVITKIDLSTNLTSDITFDATDVAFQLAITPDGKYVYAVLGSSRVLKIDLAAGDAISYIPLGVAASGSGIAITPDGTTAYVSCNDGNIVKINLLNNSTTSFQPVTDYLALIAITPDGKFAYVADFISSTVLKITLSNSTVTTIPVGLFPWSVSITPDGKYVYVVNTSDNTVTRISVSDDSTTPPVPVGNFPYDIAITPDSKYGYVTPNSSPNQVNVIDVATNTLIDTITFDPGQSGVLFVTITPDQAPTAVFTQTVSGTAVHFDGSGSLSPVGAISKYDWDFGDGITVSSSQPTVDHTYQVTGTYNVTLTVTNSAGTSTKQVFTGQTVSNNGGPSATLLKQVVVGQNPSTPPKPPRKFHGHLKSTHHKGHFVLKTEWKKSCSKGVTRYEIFNKNTLVATVSNKDLCYKTKIYLKKVHSNDIPHKYEHKIYKNLESRYKVRAVSTNGTPSTFVHLKMEDE